MKKRRFIIMIALFVTFFSFNVFAMTKNINGEPELPTPENEVKHEDRSLDYKWTWLDDDLCVQFNVAETWKRSIIQKRYDMGFLRRWGEADENGNWKLKTRNTYAGKWTQAEDETWSFEFDDHTIPVGVTKIDDVLYAFNTFGELQEGYEYYDGLTTGADGVVNSDNPEFLAWLETQYVPACTSHE